MHEELESENEKSFTALKLTAESYDKSMTLKMMILNLSRYLNNNVNLYRKGNIFKVRYP